MFNESPGYAASAHLQTPATTSTPSGALPDGVRLLSDALGGNTDAALGIMANAGVWDKLAAIGRDNSRKVIEERLVVLRRALTASQKQRAAMQPVHGALLSILDWKPRAESVQVFDCLTAAVDGCVLQLTDLIATDEAALALLTADLAPKEGPNHAE